MIIRYLDPGGNTLKEHLNPKPLKDPFKRIPLKEHCKGTLLKEHS